MMASYAQLLEHRHAQRLDQDGREFIEYMIDGARRMKRMIDDLLVYSRAGRSVATHPVSLEECLDDALSNLALAIEQSGARIQRGPLPQVTADRSAMVQLLQNLVGNALKFRGGERLALCCTLRRTTPLKASKWSPTLPNPG